MATVSKLVWITLSLAVILILAGFGLLFLGTGSPVKLEFLEFKLESTNLGIAVMVLGVGLVGLILKSFGNTDGTSKPEEAKATSTAPGLGLAYAVSALDGHPIVSAGESDVFCGGASVTITLSHDLAGTSSIAVDEIEISDVLFKPGAQPLLAYKIEADKIFGAGMKEPDRYSISLVGETVLPAKWQDKTGEIRAAQGPNLLTASRRYPHLHPGQGEDVEMIEIKILPQVPGYYEITFKASYTVGGKRNRTRAKPIRIYFE